MKTLRLAVCVAMLALSSAIPGEEPAQPAKAPFAPATLVDQPVEATATDPTMDDALDKTTLDLAAGITLQQALANISAATKANMIVDWTALASGGVDKNTPINMTLNNVSARIALRSFLVQFQDHINFVVDHHQILISSTDELRRRFQSVRIYDVGFWLSDYEPGTQDETDAEEALIDAIRNSVNTDSWRELGGSIGSTKILNGKLIITQSYDVLPKLDALIDLLRKNPTKITAVYDVRDLLKDAPPPDAMGHGKLEDLVNTIETTCGRDTWRDKGGKSSSIAPFEGKLYVTATPTVHQQIEALLAMMRKKD